MLTISIPTFLSIQALDGFIIILSKKGTITFVNEKVLAYLGYPQVYPIKTFNVFKNVWKGMFKYNTPFGR